MWQLSPFTLENIKTLPHQAPLCMKHLIFSPHKVLFLWCWNHTVMHKSKQASQKQEFQLTQLPYLRHCRATKAGHTATTPVLFEHHHWMLSFQLFRGPTDLQLEPWALLQKHVSRTFTQLPNKVCRLNICFLMPLASSEDRIASFLKPFLDGFIGHFFPYIIFSIQHVPYYVWRSVQTDVPVCWAILCKFPK